MDQHTKEFQKLQKIWYDKLKKKGFSDIEQSEEYLFKWDSRRFQQQHTPEEYKEKEEYFQKAGQFLHEYKFKPKSDAIIWELYSKGHTLREISSIINKKRFKKDKIRLVILKLHDIMINTYWTTR